MSATLKLWELSPTRRGQRLLKIDYGLLTLSEEPLLGTVEIGDQRHNRREREDDREECQGPAGTRQSGMVSHHGRADDRHERQRRPDGSRDAVPHPEGESFGMEVDHFVQRRDEKTHDNRARVLLPDAESISTILTVTDFGGALFLTFVN